MLGGLAKGHSALGQLVGSRSREDRNSESQQLMVEVPPPNPLSPSQVAAAMTGWAASPVAQVQIGGGGEGNFGKEFYVS